MQSTYWYLEDYLLFFSLRPLAASSCGLIKDYPCSGCLEKLPDPHLGYTTLFNGYSIIPSAPFFKSFGIRSLTILVSTTVSTENQSEL
jgi:hypothetical protein